MNKLTLKQLRYFLEVARHNHFGRAASACAISQPALSMQIKELEESLGTALFERANRKVRLTAFGEDFVTRTEAILNSIDELEEFAKARENQVLGKLRLGIIPTIAPYLLPAIVETLNKHYSAIDLYVRESQTQKLLDELHDGKLDAAILALPISESSLTEIALFDEDFVLVRPSKDAKEPVPNAQSLSEMKLLLLEEGHCFREQALSFCNIQADRPKDVMDASSLTTLVQLVNANSGITLIPEMAIDIETRSADVSIARFDKPQPSRTIGMIWRKTNPIGDQLLQISDLVRQSGTLKTNHKKRAPK